MRNYVETLVNGITTTVPAFGETLLEKGVKKNDGYKFKKLTVNDFDTKEHFNDYTTAVENARVILVNKSGELDEVGNMIIPDMPEILSRVCNCLGVDTAIMNKLIIVPLKYVGNKLDPEKEWGKKALELKELNRKLESGETKAVTFSADGVITILDGVEISESDKAKLVKNGKLNEKLVKSITDSFIEKNADTIKTITNTKPCYKKTCFAGYGPSTFREQLEQVICLYLAGVNPIETAIAECFIKRFKSALKYGMTKVEFMVYAIANNYTDFKKQFDELKKAYDESPAVIAEQKAKALETAKTAYNEVMHFICAEHMALGTEESKDIETVADMVKECKYWLSCYTESGNVRADMKAENKKQWTKETNKLKKFIEKYDTAEIEK